MQGTSTDTKEWGPLREAYPEWLAPIERYGTEASWDLLKMLVESRPDALARHPQWVERIAPAARQIHAFWLTRRAPET